MTTANPSKGLWEAFLGALGRPPAYAGAVLDAALMIGLADGPLTLARRDALLRLIDRADSPLPRDWSVVEQRMSAVSHDGPLFRVTREGIVRGIKDRRGAEGALRVAAWVAMAGDPLSETASALFSAVAEELGIHEAEDYLQRPSADELPELRYLRAPFNDPANPRPETLFEAIAEAQEEAVVRILLFKLTAIRILLETHFEGEGSRQVHEVGTVHQTTHGRLRIDGELGVENARVFVRVIAAGEALFPGEADALTEFAAALGSPDRLILAHQGSLCPADRLTPQGGERNRPEILALPFVGT